MITASEPNVALTGRYSITQAASALGIHRNSLLKYTNSGMIKCGYRKTTARKFYTGVELMKFWRAQM